MTGVICVRTHACIAPLYLLYIHVVPGLYCHCTNDPKFHTHTPVFLFMYCQMYIRLDILNWFLIAVCLTCLSHCISTSHIVFYYCFQGHNYQYFENQILTWNSNLKYRTITIKSKDNIQTRGYTVTTVKAHRQITQLNFKHNGLQMQQVQHYLPQSRRPLTPRNL